MRSLIVLVVLATLSQTGLAKKCYQCESGEGAAAACGDEFGTGLTAADCPTTLGLNDFPDITFDTQCYKLKNTGTNKIIKRGCTILADGYDFCALAEDVESENSDLECEVCEDDSCNSSSFVLPSAILTLIALALQQFNY